MDAAARSLAAAFVQRRPEPGRARLKFVRARPTPMLAINEYRAPI